MGVKYKINSGFFKTWTPEMSYVLGFIAADGSLEDASYIKGKYLRLYSSDGEIIEKIKRVMRSEHRVVVTNPPPFLSRGKKYERKEKYMLRIGSHEIFDDLVSLGLTPRKSKTMKFINVPFKYLPHFIRGYLDGDGCISYYRKKARLAVVFTSGSKLFLEGLLLAISKLCGARKHKISFSSRAFQIRYSTREAIRLLEVIYGSISEDLFLSRKYNIYLSFMREHPQWSVIDKIRYGVVPKRLRELSAKQLFTGSSPVHASKVI